MKNKIIVLSIFTFFSLTTCLYSQIHVYDSKDQYLGVLLGTEWAGAFTILIPSLNKSVVISIDSESKDYIANIDITGTLYYLDDKCKGASFFREAIEIDKIFNHPKLGLYTTNASDAEYITPTYKYSLDDWNSNEYTCKRVDEYYQKPQLLVPIHKASFELPFNQPIALPLHFKYSVHEGFDINGNSKLGLEEIVYSLKVISGLE